MTAGIWLETLCSVTLQSSLLLMLTGWLTDRQPDCRICDRLWNRCHTLILLLTVAALLMPHFRILPYPLWPSAWTRTVGWLDPFPAAKNFLAAWLIGVLLAAIRLAASICITDRIIRNAVPVEEVRPELSRTTNIPNCCTLISPLTTTPFCWQFHRPAIVLPESILNIDDDELAAVLEHERAHLLAQHSVHLFLQRLTEILFWFNPIVWRSSVQASLHRELVSDRQAVQSLQDPSSLLRALYHLTAASPARQTLSEALTFSSHEEILRRRVEHLLRPLPDQPEEGSSTLKNRSLNSTFVQISAASLFVVFLWLPFDPAASERSVLSPWPTVSASILKEFGVTVRDYEVDAHRHYEAAWHEI